MNIIDTLLNLVEDKIEIENAVVNINCQIVKTYRECCESIFENVKLDDLLKIDSVLDYLHDELHTGHWSKVPLSVRKGYSAASFIKVSVDLY